MSVTNNPSVPFALQSPIEAYEPRHKLELAHITPPEVVDAVETFEYREEVQPRTAWAVGKAALHGAVIGPFQQIKEIGSEIKQAAADYRSIKELVREADTNTRNKFSFMAMKAWYAAPLPAYQVADDAITYPLYLHLQDQFNTGTAYGVAAGAGFALAAGMGYGQRSIEKQKASLIDAPVVDDDADNIPLVLDATVNSAPWQVVRRANEPREEGEPVKLAGRGRIAQYAGAYALVNTTLYATAEKLPMNEWVGFGAMLMGAWAIGGAYREVKELRTSNEEQQKEEAL